MQQTPYFLSRSFHAKNAKDAKKTLFLLLPTANRYFPFVWFAFFATFATLLTFQTCYGSAIMFVYIKVACEHALAPPLTAQQRMLASWC